ncbi:MAG: UvrB/UvrC motif-containing protein [Thiothrix sp.]
MRSIRHAIQFLQGRKSREAIDELVQKMEAAAHVLNFEKAAEYRDLIESLRQISQQQYVSGGHGNVDVVALEVKSALPACRCSPCATAITSVTAIFFPNLPDEVNPAEILGSF